MSSCLGLGVRDSEQEMTANEYRVSFKEDIIKLDFSGDDCTPCKYTKKNPQNIELYTLNGSTMYVDYISIIFFLIKKEKE